MKQSLKKYLHMTRANSARFTWKPSQVTVRPPSDSTKKRGS